VDSTIDFGRIRQRSVARFLKEKRLTSLNRLAGLHARGFDPAQHHQFHQHRKTFLINAEIDSVWNTYKVIGPEETWCGNMVSFGLLYSRGRNEVMYSGDAYHGLEAGQLLFLNLNLLGNFINLAVGHEVVEVNDEQKCITICYLEHGASTGTQKISLTQLPHGTTQIVHETWYRSGSFIRDRILYPGFHAKAITEFHTNVKRRAEQRSGVN
jgi:hypothetical protein